MSAEPRRLVLNCAFEGCSAWPSRSTAQGDQLRRTNLKVQGLVGRHIGLSALLSRELERKTHLTTLRAAPKESRARDLRPQNSCDPAEHCAGSKAPAWVDSDSGALKRHCSILMRCENGRGACVGTKSQKRGLRSWPKWPLCGGRHPKLSPTRPARPASHRSQATSTKSLR